MVGDWATENPRYGLTARPTGCGLSKTPAFPGTRSVDGKIVTASYRRGWLDLAGSMSPLRAI